MLPTLLQNDLLQFSAGQWAVFHPQLAFQMKIKAQSSYVTSPRSQTLSQDSNPSNPDTETLLLNTLPSLVFPHIVLLVLVHQLNPYLLIQTPFRYRVAWPSCPAGWAGTGTGSAVCHPEWVPGVLWKAGGSMPLGVWDIPGSAQSCESIRSPLFVSLQHYLPHLFFPPSTPLPSGSHLFFLCIYNSFPVLVCLFISFVF